MEEKLLTEETSIMKKGKKCGQVIDEIKTSMMVEDEHIVLLNWNTEGLNRNLNEAYQVMERDFAFRFNTFVDKAKYFFLDRSFNFGFSTHQN